MATYQYKARDKTGKLKEGLMAAESEKTVAAHLEQMGYIPVTIGRTLASRQINQFFERFQGVKPSDINMFTRLLFTLQKAGLPLLSSLSALGEQTTNKALKETIGHIARDIEGGSTLSSTLEKYPHIFNALYISMVRSGEASGRLPEILERLAILGEYDERVSRRVQSAMKYPVIIVTGIVIGFLVLITLVVPRFEALYSQFKTALPLPTRILLGINFAVTHFWWLILAVGGGVGFVMRKFINTREGMFWLDTIKLKLPIFGPLLLKLTMTRFCRITATLMRSGVPILQILDLVADTVGNIMIAGAIAKIKVSVNEGSGMLEPMRASGMFPAVVTQMVAAGEETGKLDELLLHVSDYYDSEIEYTIDNFVSLIEPILIFVLGVGVLFMALGVFLPMWSLMDLFKQG